MFYDVQAGIQQRRRAITTSGWVRRYGWRKRHYSPAGTNLSLCTKQETSGDGRDPDAELDDDRCATCDRARASATRVVS